MKLMTFSKGNVPEKVQVQTLGSNYKALQLDFPGGEEATFFVEGYSELAALVTMIADAFEKSTGDFLVPRECGCGKYLGVGTAAARGVTTGICPECAAKMKAEMDASPGRIEPMAGPDGPVADSNDGYKVTQEEHEE